MGTILTGGCYCGAIRFEVDDFFDAGYCHCTICRRFSGAPAVVWANTPAHDFRVTRGEPKGFSSSDHWMPFFEVNDDLLSFADGELTHPNKRVPWRANLNQA